ncbi:biotin transporter BioY [Coprobacillaceae bacterium CR2/5/TPMF4]|nr:biotin transporter BioY [Coprobacillaceae bacterium CR2/5/TPMF4]
MALVIALIVKRNEKLSFKIIALIIGTAVCYLIGTLWFIYVTNTSLIPALTMCVIPFLPGDTLKIIISIILANRLNSKIAN